jgi:hypothetical protein
VLVAYLERAEEAQEKEKEKEKKEELVLSANKKKELMFF